MPLPSSAQAAPSQLPGPAIKVKEIRAEAIVREVLVVPDAVVVQGTVHKQIFWVGTDQTVHHTPENIPFTQIIPVPGARPGMLAQVQSAVEHLTFSLSPDGTTVFQKVLVRSSAVVAELQQVGIALGMGPLVQVEVFVAQEPASHTVASQHTLAQPAVKLTEVRATIQALTALAGTGTVSVSGLVHYQVFFVGMDGRQHHQTAETPFEFAVPVPGAEPGFTARVELSVVNVEPTLIDPVTLSIASLLSGSVTVTRPEEVTVATGPGPTLKLPRLVGEAPVFLSDTADLTLGNPASQVLSVTTTIGPVTARVQPGQVFLSGTLESTVEYVDAVTGELRSETFPNPFSAVLSVPGAAPGMDASVQLAVTSSPFEVTGPQNVRVSATLSGRVVVTELILVPIQPGNDLLILAEVVVGTGTSQVLIERPIPIVPVAPEVLQRVIRVEELAPVSAQTLVQALVPLPVPAIKIKEVRGEARLVGVEQFGNRALGVRGILHLQVFVVGEDDIVHHAAFDQPFQVLVPFTGTPGPDLRIELEIEKILAKLVQDGRAVSVVAVIRVTGGVGSARQVPVVLDILGADVVIDRIRALVDLVQGETVLTPNVTGVVALSAPAPPTAPLPAEAQPVGFQAQVGTNQAVIRGTVRVVLSYTGTDGRPHIQAAELPVELTATLPGVRPGMTPHLTVTVTLAEALANPLGTAASVRAQLSVLIKVVERVVLDLITDVRGPAVISVERQTVLLDVIDDGIPQPVPVSIVTNVTLAGDPLAGDPSVASRRGTASPRLGTAVT